MFSGLSSAITDGGPLRIEVDDLSLRTFIRHDDVNLDFQPHQKRNRTGNQCSMAIDDNRFAIAG
jgi:hypothetical protein